MSADSFWMLCIVLLRPKLRKEDAEILSTAQIVDILCPAFTSKIFSHEFGSPGQRPGFLLV
ncbi:hypothetical protein EJB05_35130 [Eragrostis curvula]|uniref:Uncharacterized protein n=1 Tax=Eragrostis curvula TaxID=38414 RepID=A0A5J9U6A4_9POAL|nr:hypothetical protein EJB05_35130 [Eragrostis curvula]